MINLKHICIGLFYVAFIALGCDTTELTTDLTETNPISPGDQLVRGVNELQYVPYDINDIYYVCERNEFHFPFEPNLFIEYFGTNAQRGRLTATNSAGGGTGFCNTTTSQEGQVFVDPANYEWIYKPDTYPQLFDVYLYSFIYELSNGNKVIDEGCYGAGNYINCP